MTSEELGAAIRARTERQAMDWSLVLASEGIEVTIDRDPVDGVWRLIVPPAEEARARASIRQYRVENRGFEWHREVPGSDFWWDGRATFWALAVSMIFLVSAGLVDHTIFDTHAVKQGEWWRAVTAVWLHRDVAHLASNVAIGLVFLGVAMARYGAGIGLLGGLLAGSLANVAGLVLRGEDYRGLGASGLVMGALGMIVAQAVPSWRSGRKGNRWVLTSLGTGAFLFILLGTDQSSDILAHAAGFVFGVGLGSLAALLPIKVLPAANRVAMGLFLLLACGCWWLASR